MYESERTLLMRRNCYYLCRVMMNRLFCFQNGLESGNSINLSKRICGLLASINDFLLLCSRNKNGDSDHSIRD